MYILYIYILLGIGEFILRKHSFNEYLLVIFVFKEIL